MDAPLGDGLKAGTLADLVSAGDGDPFEAIRAGELHALVGDIDEDAIAALPDEQRLALRERLLAAGFVPSTAAVPA